MLVQIGQPVDHGFDSPLGLLSDCHRRIERFLSALVTIARSRRGTSLTRQERDVLEGALSYFSTAAPRHSADEEESLFPRLRSSGDPLARTAIETIQHLLADHRFAEQHHEAVDLLARCWLSQGALSPGDAASLLEHVSALETLYRAHIKIEEEELFPAAGRILTAAELEAIGREMAARRDVPFAPPATLSR
jgi:hemerythrin-like domain-containing protein